MSRKTASHQYIRDGPQNDYAKLIFLAQSLFPGLQKGPALSIPELPGQPDTLGMVVTPQGRTAAEYRISQRGSGDGTPLGGLTKVLTSSEGTSGPGSWPPTTPWTPLPLPPCPPVRPPAMPAPDIHPHSPPQPDYSSISPNKVTFTAPEAVPLGAITPPTAAGSQ